MKPHSIAILVFYLFILSSSTTSYARLLRSKKDAGIAKTEEERTLSSSWTKDIIQQDDDGDANNNTTSTTPQTRVVGGTIASKGDFPWFVAPKDSLFLCGASLIHNDIGLSAAHVSLTHSR